MTEKQKELRELKKTDIKSGFRFFWHIWGEYGGEYKVICFEKDLSVIFCYKPKGIQATIKRDGELAKFDERIISNSEFLKLKKKQND